MRFTRARFALIAAVTLAAAPQSAFAQSAEGVEPAAQALLSPPTKDTPEIPLCNDDRLEVDPALHKKQRACLLLQDLSAPTAILGAGFSATFARIAGTDPSTFGTGWKAFGLGATTRYAQSAARSTGGALIAGEDPRHHRHTGTGGQRFGKAAAETFRVGSIAGALSGARLAPCTTRAPAAYWNHSPYWVFKIPIEIVPNHTDIFRDELFDLVTFLMPAPKAVGELTLQ